MKMFKKIRRWADAGYIEYYKNHIDTAKYGTDEWYRVTDKKYYTEDLAEGVFIILSIVGVILFPVISWVF
jgi:hypothetical protein